jgi:predicted Zn finger-like uncharacterized protein
VKLSCPSCGAKYSIADEKVNDRLAKIRCRKCSATIIIDGKVSPPNVYTSDGGSHAGDAGDGAAAPGPAAGEYSVDFGDNDQRTMSADDILQAYRRGELTRETYCWAEGMGDWTSIGDVPELAGLLDSSNSGAGAAPAQPRAAARSGSGRGSAHDLFGGIETAGSEADVTTSAPQPAPSPIATGARNESSVLFSLSALTASAGPSGAAPTKTSPSMAESNKVDDSGLIDLKALTSSVANAGPVGPLGLGTAPLGMAAPLGGITAPAISTDDHMARPQGGKTGLYIAAALVVVGALIAGAIVFTSSKEAPAAAASAVTTPVVTAAPTATETAKKEELAAPPATGTAETAPSASAPTSGKIAAVPKKGGGGSSSPKSKGGGGSSAPEKPAPSPPPAEPEAKKAPPKPKPNACACGPGDLMCAMKCAAGH